VSPELQTGSTAVAVEAVPGREVSCLSVGLQRCTVHKGWGWKISCAKLEPEEDLSRRSGSDGRSGSGGRPLGACLERVFSYSVDTAANGY